MGKKRKKKRTYWYVNIIDEKNNNKPYITSKGKKAGQSIKFNSFEEAKQFIQKGVYPKKKYDEKEKLYNYIFLDGSWCCKCNKISKSFASGFIHVINGEVVKEKVSLVNTKKHKETKQFFDKDKTGISELYALNMVLEYIKTLKPSKYKKDSVVIVTDSVQYVYCINELKIKKQYNEISEKIKNNYKYLIDNGYKIKFRHVKSHNGCEYNDYIDEKVRLGSRLTLPFIQED